MWLYPAQTQAGGISPLAWGNCRKPAEMPPGGKPLPLPLTWCVSLISFFNLFFPPEQKLLLGHWQPRLTGTPKPWHRYFFAYFTLSTFCFQGMKQTTWPLLMGGLILKYNMENGGCGSRSSARSPLTFRLWLFTGWVKLGKLLPFSGPKIPPLRSGGVLEAQSKMFIWGLGNSPKAEWVHWDVVQNGKHPQTFVGGTHES